MIFDNSHQADRQTLAEAAPTDRASAGGATRPKARLRKKLSRR